MKEISLRRLPGPIDVIGTVQCVARLQAGRGIILSEIRMEYGEEV
jgi:hypothetical protein